uniref:poly(ADP-ribose) glycohydrolase n=1 Tax=Haemonchus contortus TaxID=6289 RepID=A0A7I5EA99_HAECO
MSEDEEEQQESVIPEIALDAAVTGHELPKIVKRKVNDADSNMEIEESSDEEEAKKAQTGKKKNISKQTSLTSFLSSPPSGTRWKPVHKQATSRKKVEVVKKKIAIDPQDPPKTGKVSSVVAEVSSDDNEKCEDETKRLEKSIQRAKRKSIKQYLVKLSSLLFTVYFIPFPHIRLDAGAQEKDKLDQSAKAVETPKRAKKKKSLTEEDKVDIVDLDGEAEMNTASGTPVEEVVKDLEVILEVHKTPSRSKKRLRNLTPRAFLKSRSSMSMDDYQDSDYNRTAYSTPRRKISRHRSYSPLNFKFDDDDVGISKTPVVPRRKPDGETSIFDLPTDDQELLQHLSPPSTSGLVLAAELLKSQTDTAAVIVLDDEDSDQSEELNMTTHSLASAEVSVVGDVQIAETSSLVIADGNEDLPSSQNVVLSSQTGSMLSMFGEPREQRQRTPSPASSDIVILGTIERTPTKSKSLTANLLYSPRKMALNNEERRRIILSRKKDDREMFPNLDRLVPEVDYCAFDVRSLGSDMPPQPVPKQCSDTDLSFDNPTSFVRLPWSTANISNGFHQSVMAEQEKYVIIDRALRALVDDGAHCIEAVIVSLKECAPWIKSFDGLLGYMEGLTSVEHRNALEVMGGIAKLAVNAKFILTAPVPLLRANRSYSVTLSQEQCACLLAHAFFCTYRRERHAYNRINMASIFDGRNPLSHVKLHFILHYFAMVLKKMPNGCVSFRRESLNSEALPDWENEDTLMPLVAVASDGSIEDSPGCLQVDFANEYIGGGVLNSGAVQEEIRFLICPEMMVSCLLCEKMGPHEVIHIVGAQRYSSYYGYGGSLQWAPFEDFDREPRDKFGRVRCELVAMDAKLFKPGFRNVQYRKENIDRELNKAYAGFLPKLRDACPVATGNWGCGVFGGDKELKSLIQMMAAACAGRNMIYYTFANKQFEISMNEHYEKLLNKKVTVGMLYKALISYEKERERNSRLSVYEHVYAFISEIACTAS